MSSPPVQRRRRVSVVPYALLVPVVAVLVAALAYPLARQVIMSFQHFGLAQQMGTKAPTWVGLDNYRELFADPYMWTVIVRSLLFCAVNAVVTMVIGMAVAHLMAAVHGWVRIALQTSLLLAWSMPLIAAMTIWQWLFDTERGVINWLLVRAGADRFAFHNWLASPLSFFFVATVIIVWVSVPFVAFSVYAALTQVPEETLEAAALDGASGWGRFRLIVLPMIKPVLLIVGLLQIIWDLRVFAQIKLLQDAGSIPSETNLLGTYIYQLGISQSDFGMSAAVAIFVLLLTIGISFFYVRVLLRDEDAL